MIKPPYFSKSRHNHKPLIFHGDYTQRLTAWRKFRDRLETEPTALRLTLQLYQQCPLTHTQTNFFDRSTWPMAWNLIEKNDYNTVDRLLGMWYTLRLTDQFVRSNINLIQCVDKNSNAVEKTNTCHALAVDHQYLVLENSAILHQKEFDNQFISQYSYISL